MSLTAGTKLASSRHASRKDPDERWQSVSDVGRELEWILVEWDFGRGSRHSLSQCTRYNAWS